MWPERAKRLAIITIIGAIAYLVLNSAITLVSSGQIAGSLSASLGKTSGGLLEKGGAVLGKFIQDAPINPALKKDILLNLEVEKQTQTVYEETKKLPQTGLKEAEKLLFKDFCQQVLDE